MSFINSAANNKRDSCHNHKCESLGHELGEWESGKEEGRNRQSLLGVVYEYSYSTYARACGH